MTLENQVVSLELAHKMDALGFEAKSLFYWHSNLPLYDWKLVLGKGYSTQKSINLPAYTVAELGEMLPQILKIKKVNYQLFCSVGMDKQWFVVYANENDYADNAPFPIKMWNYEADARAAMLIYLKENKLT